MEQGASAPEVSGGMSHFSETTSSDIGPRRVAYFYDPDVGSYYYGEGHPMKPQRIKMTHQLVVGYDLYRHMDVYRPHKASEVEMSMFHAREYVFSPTFKSHHLLVIFHSFVQLPRTI